MAFIISEMKHLKDHWFSCFVSCLVVHIVMDTIETIFSALVLFLQ